MKMDQEFILHKAVLEEDIEQISDLIQKGAFIDLQDQSGNTALHLATSLGFVEVVNLLLEQVCDLDLQNDLLETPVHIAVRSKNKELVDKLLKKGASVFIHDKQGNCPLMLAVKNNFEDGLDLLLKTNFDVYSCDEEANSLCHIIVLQKNLGMLERFINSSYLHNTGDKYGRTPLHLAIDEDFQPGIDILLEAATCLFEQDDKGQTILHSAVLKKNYRIIEKLIKMMASDLYEFEDRKGRTAFDLAVLNNDQIATYFFLRNATENYNANGRVSAKDEYPLHTAVLKHNKTWLRSLLRESNKIDSTDNEGRTPLQWSLVRNFSSGIKILLGRGADVNLQDNLGNTALYYSIMGKHVHFIETLIEKGADINHRNNYGYSPIYLAITNNFEPGVKLLLANGVNVRARDAEGNTLLHTAVLNDHSKGNKIVKLVLSNEEVDLNAENSDGQTAIHLAAQEGLESVISLLLEKGVNVNARNADGLTPLHISVGLKNNKRNIKIVNLLCENGADIELPSIHFETALHLAASNKYSLAVKLLLKKGAAVNSAGGHGNASLHYALSGAFDQENSGLIVNMLLNNGANLHQRNGGGFTAIHMASSSGFETVVKLLVEKGANVHELNNNQRSCLHFAVDSAVKNKSLVEQLLALGLDPNLKDRNGRPPIHLAVENSFDTAVKLLLDHEAYADATDSDNKSVLPLAGRSCNRLTLEHLINHCKDINQTNQDGTALHSAVRELRYENIRLLLKNKINVNLVNDMGDTALHEACKLRHDLKGELVLRILQLLINHGADVNAKTRDGSTILHLVIDYMEEKVEVVKLFLDNYVCINEQDCSGNTPLHIALLTKKVDIVEILLNSGANLSLKNHVAETVLHIAVEGHLTGSLDLLLKSCSEINSQNSKGDTCLHIAVIKKYFAILKVLLAKEDIIEIKNENGLSPTYLAASQNFQSGVSLLLERAIPTNIGPNFSHKESLLMHAILKRNRSLIKRLIRQNVDVNFKYTYSALHLAILRNFGFGVKALITAGALIDDKDVHGNTPLHLSALVKSPSIMKILLTNSACVHSINGDYRTPLHVAALTDFTEGVNMLLENGATLNCQDCDGNTPLHLAMLKVHTTSACVLIENGAKVNIANRKEESFLSMRLKSEVMHSNIEDLCIKLNVAIGGSCGNDYAPHGNNEPDEISSYNDECDVEISKMKSYCFGTNTLVDVLKDHNDPQFIVSAHLRNILDSTSFEEEFPIYASMLNVRFKMLHRRYNQLCEASTISITANKCTDYVIHLPTEIKRRIMSEISHEDLATVLMALTKIS